MSIDYFGYLGIEESYAFDGGRITVVKDFRKVKKWIEKYTNKDGILYPLIQKTFTYDPFTMEEKEEIPKTERPTLLHRLPLSHSIEIDNGTNIEEQRKGPSAFLIHLLGFLMGYRLQFHDWWIDGRVPIELSNGLFAPKDTVEHFLSSCFRVWKSWEAVNQRLITNLLFMFSRSAHYEWDWERFAVDYMVIDGLWKLSCNLGFTREPCSHSERIIRMCDTYRIPKDLTHINKIVGLRNDLFHETIWDKGQPCSAGSSESNTLGIFIRNMATRIIPAVFSYNTPFVRTEWWHFGSFTFDKAV